MTTEMSFDVMQNILPYVVEINGDEEIQNAKKAYIGENGNNDPYMLMNALLPLLLARHRKAVYILMGSVCGKTAEEVAAQDFKTTLADWKAATEFVGEMAGFFVPAARMVARA